MIITHMPVKMAVVTALVIALVLAACAMLYVAMFGRSEWRVFQGSGQTVKASEGAAEYFSIRTSDPAHGPWFEFKKLATPTEPDKSAAERYAVSFMARTTTGFTGTVELVTASGVVYEQKLAVPVTADWERVVLHLAQFRPKNAGPDAPAKAFVVPPKTTELEVVFVIDGAAAKPPESLVLEVSRPILEKIVAPE